VLADRFAAWLFYVAITAAVVTFAPWSAVGSPDDSVVRTVTVLVISCPHALRLAFPLVIAISTAVSAKAGILVKDRLAPGADAHRRRRVVRQDRHPDQGQHTVTDVAAVAGHTGAGAVAGSGIEADSEHPLAARSSRPPKHRQRPASSGH
jgi:Cu2+-exporting ATPase